MTPEERGALAGEPDARPVSQPGSGEASIGYTTDAESLRRQIRQTRSEMEGTIQGIERQLDADRLKARAEEVADHVIREATERAKEVVLEVTDHAKEAAKEITDHALAEAKLTVRDMTGQASAAAREATIGKVENMVQNASQRASGAGSNVVEVIRRNPMATALVGLGLGWMLLGNRSGSGGTTSRRPSYYGRDYYGRDFYGRDRYSTGQPSWTSRIHERTDEQASDLGEKVGEKFGEAQAAARGALDQVQETAGDVAGQAQELARDAGNTASDVGSTVMDTIQQNPLPALVAAASLGYLIFNRPGAGAPAPIHEARYRAERAAGQLRESTGQLAGGVQETAGEMADRIQETTGRVTAQAQETFDEFGNSLQSQALHTQYRFEQLFSDHPLIVGGAALALGLMAGLPVPQTRQEHELMGQASSQLIDRAQSVAQETAQKVQRAVEQSGTDDELRRQAQEVADEAKEVAQKLDKPA